MSATNSTSTLEGGLETVRLRVENNVAVVTLNRPEAMNAFNIQLKEEVGGVFQELALRDDVRAVVLTGSGRAFSAGGDIVQMDSSRAPATTRARMHHLLYRLIYPLARIEKPVVAAVNGHCHGLGLSIALACDITYASRSAQFSMAFTRVGLVPDGAAIYFLPRIVGLNVAKELVLTGRRFGADEALSLGLIRRVVDDERLLDEAMDTARELAKGATLALGLSKRLLEQAHQMSLEDAAELEKYAQAIAMASVDHAEGISAFAEKRKPVFRGS
jgi:2-(1,2-epoxy-1,2-dihydrophenyl)acetyl-CoA isomerase